jgi:hypothetical protein
MQQASPLWVQMLTLIFGPPVMACLVWLLSRGWAMGVQGGRVSEKTKRRQKIEFWSVLIGLYILGFGIALYAQFIKR